MNLTPFIVTKIVHDLAGCAGAVLNTSELLAFDVEAVSDVAPVLNESAQTLVTRLKFFRCLFGSKTDVPADIAQKYLKTLSMPYQVQGAFDTPFDLGIVLLAIECLPKGGVIEKEAGGFMMRGKTVMLPDELTAVFAGKNEEMTPHAVIFFWVKEQLDAVKRSAVFQSEADGIHIILK